MNYLHLHGPNGNIIRSIPRDDETNIDFASLTSTLVEKSIHFNWLSQKPDSEDITDLHFNEDYMAKSAYLLWNYLLKHADS